MATTPKSAAEIAQSMVAAMNVADPELDTSIGAVTRKIIDVTAEQIAPAYAVAYLTEWLYDINTKSGSSLDDYVNQFGIFRIGARRATGLITFTRSNAATVNVPIPGNVYVVTGTTPQVSFVTVGAATIIKGASSVTVPIQAVNGGSSGNLPVGSITALATGVSSIKGQVVQADATSGGSDAESDDALRLRFQKTVFKNLAGTQDMFLGIALEDPTPDDDVPDRATHAAVIGPTSQWREQVQVVNTADDGDDPVWVAQSSFPHTNAKTIFPDNPVFGPDIDNGQILTQGVHYTFDVVTVPGGVTATVTGIGDNLVAATYDLSFEYVSSSTRNDPANGITNRVDVWVSGEYPEAASETTYFQPVDFSIDADNPMYFGRFQRTQTTTGSAFAASSSKFLQLAFGPILTFPSSVTISGTTYVNGTDFFVVHDVSAAGLGLHSLFGLEFLTGHVPPTNAQIVLGGSGGTGYFYNRLPADVEDRARQWKLVGSDLMVHQAVAVPLVFNFAIMYQKGYTQGAVQSAVDAALSTWVNSVAFNSAFQASDVLQVAHNVAGVDNVRFLTADDDPAVPDVAHTWGIEVVSPSGVFIANLGTERVLDAQFADNGYPTLYDVRYVTKAANTYNQGV